MNLTALILAAGRGERMRPLTDATPKPLLPVRGKPLIEWHLEALARDGVRHVVINTAWLEEQIPAALGDGARWGLDIRYSMEGRDHGGALETAGGIAKALPMLGDAFWVLAADVFMPGFVFDPAAARRFTNGDMLAHLWLVANPQHHAKGDFGLAADGTVLGEASQQFTYSTVGLYRRTLFAPPWCDIPAGNAAGMAAPLAPLLRKAIAQGLISGEIHRGGWTDVGTPERLAQLGKTPMS